MAPKIKADQAAWRWRSARPWPPAIQRQAASLLQQLAADPRAASLLPFLTALQAITTGSRDRSLAEDPGLSYDQAAEVLLLIEALQRPEADAGG
jgi:hypothetical protein